MDIKTFLKKYYTQLTEANINTDNEFLEYEGFKKFIYDHYSLEHIKQHNYIKYVKIKRFILVNQPDNIFRKLLDKINELITIMADNNTFPRIDIKKYMFRLNTFKKIINERKKILEDNIKLIRSIFDLKKSNELHRFKILCGINTLSYRLMILKKYSKIILFYIRQLMNLEKEYDIEHELIEINNMHRSFLGKKSEYEANKILTSYVNILNNIKHNGKSYFYETNINFIKLLNIKTDMRPPIKGEIDGMIISFDKELNEYTIENFIEVKSSIKSTFDDVPKFLSLQNFLLNMDFTENLYFQGIHQKYTFTRNSFMKIIYQNISIYVIYICINNNRFECIEKSHLYFFNVLKIIDDNFIQKFYLEEDDSSVLKEKHDIILKNLGFIDQLFDFWKKNTDLDGESNIFINKYI